MCLVGCTATCAQRRGPEPRAPTDPDGATDRIGTLPRRLIRPLLLGHCRVSSADVGEEFKQLAGQSAIPNFFLPDPSKILKTLDTLLMESFGEQPPAIIWNFRSPDKLLCEHLEVK